MRTIAIIIMCLLCAAVQAGDKKKKKSTDGPCCRVYLKDGTTHEGYIQNWFDTTTDQVRLQDYDARLFAKSKKWKEELVDSVMTRIEDCPTIRITWVPLKAKLCYIGQEEVPSTHRIFMAHVFKGRNVSFFHVEDRYFGNRVAYYAPWMDEAHVIFKENGKLTDKRRATLLEEFRDYPTMVNFINRMEKDDLKKNFLAFFIRLDEAMGETHPKKTETTTQQ